MIENIFPNKVPNYVMRNRKPKHYPLHMMYAFLEIGVKETRPISLNPRISEYFKVCGGLELTETSSWCGAFMAYIMDKAYQYKYIFPKEACQSQWWLRFGVTSSEPIPGDLVILQDRNDHKFGHVGLYVKETRRSILILGGNQSDQVCYQWYKKQGKHLRLANYRRVI